MYVYDRRFRLWGSMTTTMTTTRWWHERNKTRRPFWRGSKFPTVWPTEHSHTNTTVVTVHGRAILLKRYTKKKKKTTAFPPYFFYYSVLSDPHTFSGELLLPRRRHREIPSTRKTHKEIIHINIIYTSDSQCERYRRLVGFFNFERDVLLMGS